jgi:type I restriction enzyme S subunit
MKSEPLLNPKFLYYSVLSEWFIDVVNSSAYGTKMPRASWDFIGNMSMLLPSLQEQTAIANFLDQQTTKIESMISAKTKLIEKLKEKRNAIITHAVTKGFDSNAKMKPSGIEWIGDIPEGWEVKKISWLFEFISSGTTPASNDNSYYNGEIPWVNTGDLNDGILMSCNKYITQSALDDYSALKLFDEGTLLIAMYGATIGKLAILSFKATTNQACCALGRPKNMDAKFVFYWLLGMKENIISLAYGGGQPNISQNLIKSLKISIPKNIQDQTIIANYLDQETKRIDCIIAKTQTSIQKLKEYQTALISSAVTGKIDARGE